MGTEAAKYAFKVRGLGKARETFLQLAWSCLDETGLVEWSRRRLAAELDCDLRTIERHLPVLVKLGLVGEEPRGFRLVDYIQQRIRETHQQHRQNGGILAQKCGILSEEKERTKEKEEFCMSILSNTPLPPSARGDRRRTREERKQTVAPCARPELQAVSVHRCVRCETPHDWPCQGLNCSCEFGKVQWACDTAIVAVKR